MPTPRSRARARRPRGDATKPTRRRRQATRPPRQRGAAARRSRGRRARARHAPRASRHMTRRRVEMRRNRGVTQRVSQSLQQSPLLNKRGARRQGPAQGAAALGERARASVEPRCGGRVSCVYVSPSHVAARLNTASVLANHGIWHNTVRGGRARGRRCTHHATLPCPTAAQARHSLCERSPWQCPALAFYWCCSPSPHSARTRDSGSLLARVRARSANAVRDAAHARAV